MSIQHSDKQEFTLTTDYFSSKISYIFTSALIMLDYLRALELVVSTQYALTIQLSQ